MSSDVVLLVNPTSGSGRGRQAAATTVEALRQQGLNVVVAQGDNAAAATASARAALDEGCHTLVTVGGDGTVHQGVQLLAGTEVALGIVPAGTGNDNARELGFPASVEHAAQMIATAITTGARRTVDAVRWHDDTGASGWFSGVLSAGFDSIVNERANSWQRLRGRLRYDIAVLRELPTFRPRPYVIEIDGEKQTTDAVLVAVGNGPAYGGGLQICSGASMDDGLLDVLLVGPVSLWELAKIYPKVSSGAHLAHPQVQLVRARDVRLETPGIVAYADGERLAHLPITCTVHPGALTVLGA